MPLYVAASLVVHRCDEIFSVDCDMASIHSLLSQVSSEYYLALTSYKVEV
jgi:hypothetical protein